MSAYQHPDDLGRIPELLSLAPVEARGFLAFDHAARRGDGLIPPRTRELVALAVALTTQCAYCLDVHTRAAKAAGVTREELAELVAIAAAVRAGASMGSRPARAAAVRPGAGSGYMRWRRKRLVVTPQGLLHRAGLSSSGCAQVEPGGAAKRDGDPR
jgi:AhpD family alkylhydroperoxidase